MTLKESWQKHRVFFFGFALFPVAALFGKLHFQSFDDKSFLLGFAAMLAPLIAEKVSELAGKGR